MCEALVSAVNKVPNTDPLYSYNYQLGDIITIQDDGWPWTVKELNDPRFRVVGVPGFSKDFYNDMIQPSKDTLEKLLIKRARFIDSNKLAGFIENIPLGAVYPLNLQQRNNFNNARTTKPHPQAEIG